jgi:hypothetical protein
MDTPALITLHQVLNSWLNEKGIYTKTNYKRFYFVLAELLVDLEINRTTSFKTMYPVIDQNNTIKVPLEYIDYVRIGYPIGGQILTLTKNDNILLPRAFSCGTETGDLENKIAIDASWVQYDYSATGGKNFMYYRYDKEHRQIVFRGDGIGKAIVLEYNSTGVSLSTETYLDIQLLPVLKNYLDWIEAKHDKSIGMNRIEMYRRDYIDKRDEYVMTSQAFTADEYLDVVRSTYKQTIKR